MAVTFSYGLHDLGCLVNVRHRSLLGFEWPDDVEVDAGVIQQLCSLTELIGLEQAVNLSGLGVWPVSFLLDFSFAGCQNIGRVSDVYL